jgi:dTMP kinase
MKQRYQQGAWQYLSVHLSLRRSFYDTYAPMIVSSSASASSVPQRGAFIVLEGVDRCGKTTQVGRLVHHLTTSCAALAGAGASAWGFPNRTTAVGQLINAYLQSSSDSAAPLSDEAIHLLFSANRWESAATLHATLAAGTHVVCDRYAYSGVAFSTAKKGLSASWCVAPDRGLPAPDAVVYLDLEPEAAAARGG